MAEIYVSTDVETDGPIPGPHSLLSLGAVAFTAEKQVLSTFSQNLEQLPGASPDPETMAWWAQRPKAWAASRVDCKPPKEVMLRFKDWIASLKGEPVFVAYPVGFDFLFVYWYLIHFTGSSPFGHAALDVRSFAMAQLKTDFKKSGKRHMPKHWFDKKNLSHVAVDDALQQGALFCNMLKANRKA